MKDKIDLFLMGLCFLAIISCLIVCLNAVTIKIAVIQAVFAPIFCFSTIAFFGFAVGAIVIMLLMTLSLFEMVSMTAFATTTFVFLLIYLKNNNQK